MICKVDVLLFRIPNLNLLPITLYFPFVLLIHSVRTLKWFFHLLIFPFLVPSKPPVTPPPAQPRRPPGNPQRGSTGPAGGDAGRHRRPGRQGREDDLRVCGVRRRSARPGEILPRGFPPSVPPHRGQFLRPGGRRCYSVSPVQAAGGGHGFDGGDGGARRAGHAYLLQSHHCCA